MTSPVVAMEADDYLFKAVALMRRRKLGMAGCRPERSPDRHPRLGDSTRLPVEPQPATAHRSALARESIEGLQRVKRAQVELAGSLLEKNVPASEVQSLLTEINNDIHRRALKAARGGDARRWLGRVPAPCCHHHGVGRARREFSCPRPRPRIRHRRRRRGPARTYRCVFSGARRAYDADARRGGLPALHRQRHGHQPSGARVVEWRRQIDRWIAARACKC